jgi:hypothetical protein
MHDVERLNRIIALARGHGPLSEKDLRRIIELDEKNGPFDDQTLLKLIKMSSETEAAWRGAKVQLISIICILGVMCLLVLVVHGC